MNNWARGDCQPLREKKVGEAHLGGLAFLVEACQMGPERQADTSVVGPPLHFPLGFGMLANLST